ncbi:hypothetical protein CJ030_MR4G023700 [Morella rubra]|uniref:Uncharacterized protein n=1 Tax=Morella rubra TaxID=262757 RepID=A0A6A1VTJ5_9ROSI|nr:hypothetical protein CJ030_MR4G023700 [Morella rubra]
MVAAHRGKEIIVIYVVGFEAVPVFDTVDDVDEEQDVNMSPSSLDIGGPFFELGGHSFEVGGPSGTSYEDTEAADVEAEHLTIDRLLVTPPPLPDGKDDSEKDDGYMSDMIPSDILVSPPHSDYEAGEPSRFAPEFIERGLGSVTPVKG